MPFPTLKPLFTAIGLVVMFGGLLLFRDHHAVGLTILLTGAAMLIGGLYAWLTSPLE